MANSDATDTSFQGLQFHYVKSSHFRVIHVDGAYGGVTPRGYIHAALYNERKPIPQRTIQKLQPDGTLGPEEMVAAKEHVLREVEADLVLDVQAARHLGAWLMAKANELEQILANPIFQTAGTVQE